MVTTHMGQKIYSDGGAEPNKKFDDIFNCVDQIQRDGRTDKRRQRRPRAYAYNLYASGCRAGNKNFKAY